MPGFVESVETPQCLNLQQFQAVSHILMAFGTPGRHSSQLQTQQLLLSGSAPFHAPLLPDSIMQ
jgi:hypothetical protein